MSSNKRPPLGSCRSGSVVHNCTLSTAADTSTPYKERVPVSLVESFVEAGDTLQEQLLVYNAPRVTLCAFWYACAQEMMSSNKRPPLGSCRSGSVVHMLAASGAQVPVRMSITSRDEATRDKMSHRHIVKVCC
jgi:hypothetical protein